MHIGFSHSINHMLCVSLSPSLSLSPPLSLPLSPSLSICLEASNAWCKGGLDVSGVKIGWFRYCFAILTLPHEKLLGILRFPLLPPPFVFLIGGTNLKVR